jgi:hypothetical protein
MRKTGSFWSSNSKETPPCMVRGREGLNSCCIWTLYQKRSREVAILAVLECSNPVEFSGIECVGSHSAAAAVLNGQNQKKTRVA